MPPQGGNTLASRIRMALDFMFYIAILACVLTLLGILVGPIAGIGDFNWEPTAHFSFLPSPQMLSNVSPDASGAVIERASGPLKVKNDRMATVVGLLFCLTMLGLAAFVLDNLRGLFAALANEDPFVISNAGRVRRVGVALILAELARGSFFFLESSRVADTFRSVSMEFHPVFDLEVGAVLAGIILLGIAEVFRQGAAMKEEQDLTV